MARILVVEDEPTIATTVAEWLREVGHTIIGPANDIEAALMQLADKGADMVLLDVSLAGAPLGLTLAEMLKAQRIPFAFLTGYSETLFPVSLRDHPRLDKPFGRDQLLSVVDQLGTEPIIPFKGKRKP
jgi:CheY-like chemotaxis protein